MTDAEHHQQQLEQQEQEETHVDFKYESDRFSLNIWGDSGDVFVNISTYPTHISLHLEGKQAEVMLKLLDNALRRAKK